MKIAVLGAGLAGVSAAFYLARQGHAVTLVESEPAVCNKTSFANGGQLSYDYVDPLASPAILKKIPGMVLGFDSAFKIGTGNSFDFVTWGLKFLKNCNSKTEKQTIKNMLSLADASRAQVHQITQEYDFNFDYRRTGKLHIYADESAMEAIVKKTSYKQTLGSKQRVLTTQECVEQEPALAYSQQKIVGGTFSLEDELGDAHAFAQNLLKIAVDSYGVVVQTNTKVKSLEVQGGRVISAQTNHGVIEAEQFVVALGAYSPLLLKPLGIRIPIYPMKGYSVTFPATDKAPRVSITDAKHKMVFSTLGDKFRVAGFAQFMGYDMQIHSQYIEKMTEVCRTVFPEAADYENRISTWTGLRPMTPDSQPIIGKTKLDNLWLNTGQGMLGWTLMMGSGFKLSQLMQDNLKTTR